MFEKLHESFTKLVKTITEVELKPEDLKSHLWDFKLSLIENDVAVTVADYIRDEIEKRLSGLRVKRLADRRILIKDTLRQVLLEILEPSEKIDLMEIVERKRRSRKPCVIVFVGINGTGKTTTIAKLAHILLNNNYSVVLACSDTFRAGSIEQLSAHAKHLGVPMIKHQYGSDAAAVAYDAVRYAEARGINVVLIDTAGRMQTNKNLLSEMEKIVRVADPDLVIFVGDSLSGNDAVLQAEEFNKSVHIDGSILTKMDADAKGGAAISVTYVTKKPVLYVGIGQGYGDLEPFNPETIVDRILGKD
ncbi:TPA: signal recognition particle-docking protein FtsY [Candidatus Bathyarchaeota archaeon]|nr:signal recognition particle-docking protein FtsY [Candidatus Bathyarchaeota archaeon]